MPSLRQKVTTYFRQLSFIAEPREGGHRGAARRRAEEDDDDGNFITKYLAGRMERQFAPPPEIQNGQNPTDLPELKIGTYATGPQTITAACTGPDEGLTGIKRSKLHLSASFADDIDFIDTNQDEEEEEAQQHNCHEVRKSSTVVNNVTSNRPANKFGRGPNGARRLSNTSGSTTTTAANASSDQSANRSTSGGGGGGGMRSRKNSKTGIANLNKEASTGNTAKNQKNVETNANKSTTIVVSMVSSSSSSSSNNGTAAARAADAVAATNDQNNKNLLNAKTEVKPATVAAKKLGTVDGANSDSSCSSAQTKDAHNATEEAHKLLENATERLLREAVSNQDGNTTTVASHEGGGGVVPEHLRDNAIAGVSDWRMECEYAYGISVSLYENNMLTKEPMGNPIADCYGMVVRGDAAAMALADGVNWGDGARLAARSAVHGCLDYLDRAIFGMAKECMATTTQEVFVSLLRSLWEGHGCILEVGGALSTLTIAVVLPLAASDAIADADAACQKYVICACNVGDSLGYVYSKKHGVREFTQASHDIQSMRDMRDALGALGPADGNKPELSNLTFSMTCIERGDIVFLTSDGISDNFDPVVGKFAEAWTPDVKLQTTTEATTGYGIATKRQNKSASAIYARLHRNDPSMPTRPPRTKKAALAAATSPTTAAQQQQQQQQIQVASGMPSRPKYMRSQTVIEPRRLSAGGAPSAVNLETVTHAAPPQRILKSASGLPLVTGPQRHALTLHRLEDLLSYGINGTFSPCVSARRLCHLLIDFVRMITSARRKTLEQRELFFKLATGPDGIKREVELNRMQHRAARKRIVDSSAFTALPGKLDHATVLAYIVGGGQSAPASATNAVTALQAQEFKETNF